MSEIRATTISDLAGTGPATLTGQYAAKAWVSAGADASLLDSQNISSGTDNGTGNYTYAFSNAMSNANFAVIAACDHGGVPVFSANVGSKATSSYVVEHGYTSTAPAYVDADLANYSAIHGDLA